MSDFREWVLSESEQRGLSRVQLAERAGLSLTTVRRVLVNGQRQPGMKFFGGIARALDLPLTEVVAIWQGIKKAPRH
jgi:transcriptional regulator with XRE-family HTH domain